jgi:CTP:phosphocholine cytidylyltransferase-like protein
MDETDVNAILNIMGYTQEEYEHIDNKETFEVILCHTEYNELSSFLSSKEDYNRIYICMERIDHEEIEKLLQFANERNYKLSMSGGYQGAVPYININLFHQ